MDVGRWLALALGLVCAVASDGDRERSFVSGGADAVAGWARTVAETQLGAIEAPPPAPPFDPAGWADAASRSLEAKVDAVASLLDRMRRLVRRESFGSFAYPCERAHPHRQPSPVDLNAVQFLNAARRVEETLDLRIGRQYFMAAADGAADDGCRPSADDDRLRRLFLRRFRPRPDNVIVVVDNGPDSSPAEIALAGSIAARVVSYAKETDSIAVITRDGRETAERLRALRASDRTPDLAALISEALVPTGTNTVALVWRGGRLPDGVANLTLKENVVVNACEVGFETGRPAERPEPAGRATRVRFDPSFTVGRAATLLLLPSHKTPENKEATAEPPVWDRAQREPLVPFALPCSHFGVAVVDVHLSDLAEDVIYFNPLNNGRRAFLIDPEGRVVFHSTYSRPEAASEHPRAVDISSLETKETFKTVRPRLLNEAAGNVTVDGVAYAWRRTRNMYIIGVAADLNDISVGRNSTRPSSSSRTMRELQYHRLDLLPPPNGALCRHFKRVSTVERGTLYLSPSSFRSPFKYLHDLKNGKDTSPKLLQSCMAYLKDGTRLLSNPGLKRDIRIEVGLLYPMLGHYKRQHIYGSYNKYAVRRYAATESGVLVMFPGSILESDYEPIRKYWFKRAAKNPGQIIITPPYLDVGGAGYIVTLSYAIKDAPDDPAVVLAIDITMGFLYKVLEDSSPLCGRPDIRCFMMDDRGYLLSHPSLLDRSEMGPVERQHITHKESFVANDMLKHRGFVEKKLCRKFEDGTLQRFYSFNTSIPNPLSNAVRGEHCTRYYIAPIEGSNAFFGIVNSTCEIEAFCPCSVVDRLCLNCQRMEQNECECPCECALTEDAEISPICEMEPEKNNPKNDPFYNMASHLESCFDFRCDSYNTESNCLGVMGCEWCHLDADAESLLSSPFCSSQSSCFGGVIGAATPYGEGSLGRVMQDDSFASYSAVGPIAGCVVAVCLILAVAVYCYRQNVSGRTGEGYPDGWADGVQMSRRQSEEDVRDERSANRERPLLGGDPIVVPISPYRVITGYRRPNTAGESDHGYSTMTPHDDSEHLAFALVEPFISADGGSHENSPTVSNRRPRSDSVTVLPCGKNSIIASVTVHRNMEAT